MRDIFWDKEKQRTGYRHRKVMEILLGRELSSNEIVHHKDGNSDNNKPTNLELVNGKYSHLLLHSNTLFGGYEGRIKGGQSRRKEKEGHYWCPSCSQYLPATNFYRNRSRWNGCQTFCKTCSKKKGGG